MNQKGMGLIEVMVSVVILSIVALGIAQAMNNALLVQQTADVKQNLTSLVTSTTGIASNQITCTQAVTATPQAFGSPLQFNSLSDGTVLNSYNLTINTLSYNNPTLVGTGSDGTKAYYGVITLSASSNIPVYGSKSFAPRIILYVYLTVDSTGLITGCGPVMPNLLSTPVVNPPGNTNDPAVNHTCAEMGGTMSNGTCTIHSGGN